MKIRRVVTGTSTEGKSVFVSDEIAPRSANYKNIPQFGYSMVWVNSANPILSSIDKTLDLKTFHPAVGDTQLLIVTFSPDSVMASPTFDGEAAGAEIAEHMPVFAEKFEQDNPGMHRTQTLDYGIVLEGEIWLELDDGQIKKINKGDVVIQNGTRHAWRNQGSNPATVAFFMTGAKG